MLAYIGRRLLYMVVSLWVISCISFLIIKLPPTDYLTTYVAKLNASGRVVSQNELDQLRSQYGFDAPIYVQYGKWMGNIFKGNFGTSFVYNRHVSDLLAERLPLTILLSLTTLILTYGVAISIGIYSATHQYSFLDYLFTGTGFLGLAIPNFLIALVLMYLLSHYLGLSVGGIFSNAYTLAPWTWAKVWDMMKHLPVPIIVIGASESAALIRVMRGCLLDELRKQYVVTARSKGLAERKLLLKYPVRVALNPIVSTIGWALPAIFSGETIASTVLGIPTTGPLLFGALMAQDMYLAGSIVIILAFLTIVGTLVSDLLLVALDPRIRLTKKAA